MKRCVNISGFVYSVKAIDNDNLREINIYNNSNNNSNSNNNNDADNNNNNNADNSNNNNNIDGGKR